MLIYTFGKHAFFVQTKKDEGRNAIFEGNGLESFTVVVNGISHRSKGSNCIVPFEAFHSGENICRVVNKDGKSFIAEGITKKGNIVFPSGISQKNYIVSMLDRIKILESSNKRLIEKCRALEQKEAEDDLLSI